MRKIAIIVMKKEKLRELAKDVGRCERAVYTALSYKSDGDIPNLIRKKAIEEYGGVKTQKIVY